MQIKYLELIDRMITALLFLQVAVFNFFNISGTGIKVICALILLRFLIEVIVTGKIQVTLVKKFLAVLFILLLGFVSARFGHDYHADVFFSNIFAIIYSAVPAVYISHMFINHYDFLRNIINRAAWLINGYFLLNVIVSCIQVRVNGFLPGISLWVNPTREDLICGLMGYSSTPQFGLFSCFVILLNLYYCDFVCKKKALRAFLHGYNVLLVIFTVVISAYNDNKTVYIELPLFLLFYLYLTGRMDFVRKRIKKANYKRLLTGMVFIFAGIMMYLTVPAVHEMIYSNFIYAVELLFKAVKSDAVLGYGSADRLYMVLYSFKKYDAARLGYGMGSYLWHAGDALGFRHFGQADLGAFLCLAGVYFTIAITVLWVNNYIRIIYPQKRVSAINAGCVFGFFMLMLFYTQLITVNTISIIMLFCTSVYGAVNREKIRGDFK